MASKRITVNKNVDFHEYVDFYRNGAALDVSGWAFRLIFTDRNGNVLVTIDGAGDQSLTYRVWFNAQQAGLADLPTTGVKWYLLSKDPDDYVQVERYGSAQVKGGAAWV